MKDHAWVENLRRERLQHSSRNPGLAALMSFFVMGLGQIYAGHIDKGIILLCGQIGGLLAGYSIYAQGMVYEAITDLGGVYLVIPVSYALSVVLILVWIYNIKDAYYLSLFSEFRDWFEIERVLVPYLKGTQIKMLTHHSGSTGEPAEAARGPGSGEGAPMPPEGEPIATAAATGTARAHLEGEATPRSAAPAPEPEIIDVTATVKPSAAGAETERGARRRPRRPSRASPVLVEPAGAGSRRLVLAVGTLVVLLGIWVSNLAYRSQKTLEPRPTLFSLSGDLRGGPAATSGRGLASASLAAVASPVATPSSLPAVRGGHAEGSRSASPMAAGAAGVGGGDAWASAIQEGLALLDRGETASGIAILEATLPNTGRSHPEAWQALAKVYFDQDQTSAYEDCLQRYLGQFPEDTEAWVNLAKVQSDRQSFVTASRSLLKALNQAPSHQRANFLMGSIYRELGLAEEAVPYLSKALLDDPLNTEYNRELAAVYLELRDLKAARRHLDRVVNVAVSTGIRDEEAERLVAELERLERLASPVSLAGSGLPAVVSPLPSPAASPQGGNSPATAIIDASLSAIAANPEAGRTTAGPAAPVAGEGPAPADDLPMSGGAVLYEAPDWSPKRRGTTTLACIPPAVGSRPLLDAVIGEILPAESARAGLSSEGAVGSQAAAALARSPAATRPAPASAPMNARSGASARPLASPSAALSGGPSGKMAEEMAKAGLSPLELLPTPASGQASAVVGVSASPARSVTVSSPPVVLGAAPSQIASPSVTGKALAGLPATMSRAVSAPARPGPLPAESSAPASGPTLAPLPPTLDPAMGLAEDLADAEAIDDPALASAKEAAARLGGARVLASTAARPPVRPVAPVAPDRQLKGLWTQGFDRYLAGKWEEALPFFLEYLQKKPDPRVYDMVGVIFEKVGLEQDAFEATLQSYRLGHQDAQTLVRLGLLAEKTGKFAQGATFLDQALAKLPHRVDLAFSLARCHRQAGQASAARAVLEKIAADPHQSYAVKRRIEAELALLGPGSRR
jgi:tetratricopeptide (TPR) repeat protein/TM2 domain-containing membrane protein YozV